MKKIVIVLLLVVLFSCQPFEEELVFSGFDTTDSLMVYLPKIAQVSSDKVLIMASMAAEKQTGKVYVKLLVKNKQYNPVIQVNPFEIQLNHPAGTRTQLTNFGLADSIKVLTKGKIAEYEFVFHPINSLKLYRLTQLRGDLAQQYYLTTDFVQTSQGEALGLPPLQFQLSDTTYQAYLAAYGQEKNLRIYQLKDDATILKEKILQHLNKKLPLASNNPSQTHSVSINEQEIMIDGAVIKLLVYSLYSSIYLQISIVNHSHYPFAIDFSQLFLVSNEKKISPANLSDPRLFSLRRTPDNKKVALLKGERLQFTFLFENLEPQETCYWLLDGIEMGEKPIRVFPSGITFEFSKKPVD